jgi:hypothetical protein
MRLEFNPHTDMLPYLQLCADCLRRSVPSLPPPVSLWPLANQIAICAAPWQAPRCRTTAVTRRQRHTHTQVHKFEQANKCCVQRHTHTQVHKFEQANKCCVQRHTHTQVHKVEQANKCCVQLLNTCGCRVDEVVIKRERRVGS